MVTNQIREILKDKNLKITPQRVSILETIFSLNNHPNAQQIIDAVHKKNPNISVGTIYKTLDTFVETGVIVKVRHIDESLRYDWRVENHHHLYVEDDNQIVDYINDELNLLLEDFFTKNRIPGFEIKSVKVHINGKYIQE
ncbi:MAG: transcriptional repressor [Fermentimonas sp.]|jgi:Fur family peroxide stress response transcriptional regulator|nr:transcriptional repressor [Fermentimonas sp.]NLC86978.1 transcriptional repressor [Bacteroidales bacterium]HBT84388.1 transcriptional repressor [Porphyromonadaceae bacterium]MDD3189644.1 transcriptional repressor [Fermentimonas sp.]MDD3512043.1 transcriptional repressor [Fermentimonas sp.]